MTQSFKMEIHVGFSDNEKKKKEKKRVKGIKWKSACQRDMENNNNWFKNDVKVNCVAIYWGK